MENDSSRPATSRRGFLLGAAALVAAGGGGAAAALLRRRPKDKVSYPASPTVLLAAVAAETRLIAAIDAARDVAALAHLRADHVAHREALLGAVQLATGSPSSGLSPSGLSSSPSTAPAQPRPTLTQLREAELAAAAAAASAAASLTGAPATLLASIAACEASHAELLR